MNYVQSQNVQFHMQEGHKAQLSAHGCNQPTSPEGGSSFSSEVFLEIYIYLYCVCIYVYLYISIYISGLRVKTYQSFPF